MSKIRVYDETITAVNKKNQSLVNKATTWLSKYHSCNDARDIISNLIGEEGREWDKINDKCESIWDKYEEYLDELPKYEIKNIEKSELYLTN